MSENNDHIPLPVINQSAKVEELRKEAQSEPAPAKLADSTVVSRFLDAKLTPQQKAIKEKVIDALRTIYDPEIPVNIYDLGLIYKIDVDEKTSYVKVQMTLTAPACPVAGEILMQVQKKIEAVEGVPDGEVELVWEPAWSRAMMSEAAALELGLL